MESDSQKENSSASCFARNRSCNFTREEVKVLLSLIEENKTVIHNKSTNAAACQAKEEAWIKISKAFNKRCTEYKRSSESLKVKWENMKRRNKIFLNRNVEKLDDVTSQIHAMMCKEDSSRCISKKEHDLHENSNEIEDLKEIFNADDSNLESEDDKNDSSDDNDADNSRYRNRSTNFTPQENNLLVQCVKKEKNILFSNDNSSSAHQLKNFAWNRITKAFNRVSPRKRSTKVLRTKFSNMKRIAQGVAFKGYFKDTIGHKHERLKDENSIEVKVESISDTEDDFNFDDMDQDNNSDSHKKSGDEKNDYFDYIPDPLKTVWNSDSGIDSKNPSEYKEEAQLKIELLKFKMETAKLERKRIEDAIKTEAIENALKLRTARLNAVSAAITLPNKHPALAFTPEENPAQQYLSNYNT